jgi:AhpD family alkylhydroperoxidase
MNTPLPMSSSDDRGAAPADDPSPKRGESAPSKFSRKEKRTLTPDNLFRTVANVVASIPVLLVALVRPKTSAVLREKIALGVTSINDCRYCAWGHTHWAMANGVPLEEVNQILGFQLESLEARDPAEAAAILFAQHYAEQRDQFDPDSIENLRKHYNDAQVTEILAYVRAITLGTLTGNTVDAFLDRFRGDSQTSSDGQTGIFFEGVVAAAAAPFALVLILLAKVGGKVGMDKARSRRH